MLTPVLGPQGGYTCSAFAKGLAHSKSSTNHDGNYFLCSSLSLGQGDRALFEKHSLPKKARSEWP
jgi:hypothetical protein